MTILAQKWLENHHATKWDFWLQSRLGLQDGNTPQKNLEHSAERIVVSDAITDLLIDMLNDGSLQIDQVLSTTRMPAPAVWVEWRDRDISFGVLLEENLSKNGNVAVGVVVHKTDGTGRIPAVALAGQMPSMPQKKIARHEDGRSGFYLSVSWTYESESRAVLKGDLEEGAGEFRGVILTALFALFLMQHPKTIKTDLVVHDAKLQKKRLATNKLPLLEYTKIHIKIGENRTVRASSDKDRARALDNKPVEMTGHETIVRRRYHRVVGHFRTMRRTGDVKWIDVHYRGDPTLGVVIRERNLEKAGKYVQE